jgi:phosphoglucomutase
MKISPLAGKPAPPEMLVNIPRLVTAYYTQIPDAAVAAQRVMFGTSGHRGSSLETSFNEWHVLAITQAICRYRREQHITGPLFLGIDTHALSEPAFASALEVLAANGVEVMVAGNGEYTPTPAVSHAILTHNLGRTEGLADGIVITPSHNPPESGGFKYNPPHGGPAGVEVTSSIESLANEYLRKRLAGVKRIPLEAALRASTTHHHDFLKCYVDDLGAVIDMDVIRGSGIHMGVDPLGGAGVNYWPVIAERFKLNLETVRTEVDPTFRFMTVDWDGKIRMDPSSQYAMRGLISLKDRFDIAFACDTDHDRHGIVTRSVGLMPADHYLSVAIDYLFRNRKQWASTVGVGKTVVSSRMIDKVTSRLPRRLFEVPVGFKWFVNGLYDGSLGFCGEESAGASFLRFDGSVWTTDKDGIISALLSAEITARTGHDPGELYGGLERELGHSVFERLDSPASPEERKILANLSPEQIDCADLAGEKIESILTRAPGNNAPIGGIKVIAKDGWFAARPSGTEDIYKIYAESFLGMDHLEHVIEQAQALVSRALATAAERDTQPEKRSASETAVTRTV